LSSSHLSNMFDNNTFFTGHHLTRYYWRVGHKTCRLSSVTIGHHHHGKLISQPTSQRHSDYKIEHQNQFEAIISSTNQGAQPHEERQKPACATSKCVNATVLCCTVFTILSSRSQKALSTSTSKPPQRQSLGKPVSNTLQSTIDQTFNYELPSISTSFPE
jgi:hypothetical protein